MTNSSNKTWISQEAEFFDKLSANYHPKVGLLYVSNDSKYGWYRLTDPDSSGYLPEFEAWIPAWTPLLLVEICPPPVFGRANPFWWFVFLYKDNKIVFQTDREIFPKCFMKVRNQEDEA